MSAEQISAEDLAIHRRMVARLREGQRLAAEARRLQARAEQLAAGFAIWAEDLHERYDIAPGQGSIDENGAISRES